MKNGTGVREGIYRALCLLTAVGTLGCQSGEVREAGAEERFRVAVAGFSHETCTFCPTPTTVEAFERGGVSRGPAVLDDARGIPSYINGFISVADQEPEMELVGIVDASSAWGGSSGSWITREAFDRYTGEIVEGLRRDGPFDGVLLALHGAMAAEDFPKAEAEIVRRVREAVGEEVPVMVTYDLHGNEDEEITRVADAVFFVTTYPHVTSQQAGETAARTMLRTLRGEIRPTMALRKPGVITPSLFQGTDFSPAKDIMERAREWERQEPGVLAVTVGFGFAYADVPDVGATVIAVTDGDQALAERVAQDVSDYIWSVREPFAGKQVPKTREGVAEAIAAARAGRTPVVIADHADRLGDATHILRELIGQGASDFAIATLADEGTIARLQSQGAKVGERVTVDVGAGSGHPLAGKPVRITGELEFLGEGRYTATGPMGRGATRNLGTVAVVGFGENNHVILTPTLHQVLDDGIFGAVGLDLDDLGIIALKSRVHMRAFYDERAGAIVEVDAPGLGPADLTQHAYRNIPRDIYPMGGRVRGGGTDD
jgi:microcystin degradation protein MlrC